MKKTHKTIIVAVAAVGTLIGGALLAGKALAQMEESNTILSRAAEILGMDEDKITSAFTTARNERIDQMLEDGEITEEQADRMKENDFMFGMGGHRGPGGPMGLGRIEDLAEYLAMDRADLIEQWKDADNLATVIEAKGKSVDNVKQYLLEKLGEHLDEMVADEKITEDQAAERLENAEEHLDEFLNDMSAPPKGHPGNGGFGLNNKLEEESE
ncbi:hypothetical protein JW710_01640 [Candidatus Dojkabacteria bacterium]|nr:hypothetical protein [Candidatus Dojkabacteria bacterium]